ncbi:MAG: NTP transferase domain-containing protein [Sediminibacterium sp.]|jgi:MurNAc alpha-1-phosphate uridylyltransferase|nr:NTP transferase domain-containing protein [Sediminibacterium sp.]
MKAMILAAGLGTRLKPFTDKHPKALAMVNGKSLLQRNIEYLQKIGITEVLVNVHHFADQIIDAINTNNGWGSTVTISDETDAVLETGGGLKKAAWYFKNETSFLLINADILTNLDLDALVVQHTITGALATLAVSVRNSSRYFLFDEAGKLCGWKNQNTGEYKPVHLNDSNTEHLHVKAFSGIQVIDTKLLALMQREGKFSMVDVYLDLCATHTILAYDHTGATLLDVGKPESLALAATLFE